MADYFNSIFDSMHLKLLKLAGFKSFVDPSVVHFPSQLVAVVGPNGCGKSNIIDAVRWVMGESSAKNLRGESMVDVIFNGSANRKSIGQASVELVFDNSLGRLTGPFASYGEIAVKRVVTRDGDSSYYLNNSRCRRRDITDIFLGTGAGSRGYSIIGQGTISRLIEARPEELRSYLEEAAGVSKYKERRRETLQRIAHTRENLTRVADIRDELEKQLQRLERQAKAAQRYTLLKKEEQLCRAEILALKWQDFVTQQELKQNELHDLALSYEQQQSLLTKANKDRIVLNETLYDASHQLQQIQALFYQSASDIARLQETIQQQDREKKRLEHERQQMQEDWQVAAEQLKHDKEELLSSQQIAHNLTERLLQLTSQFKEQEQLWQDSQKKQTQWNERWQEVRNQSNNEQREFQVAQIQAQHIEQKRQQTLLRLEKLKLEQTSIALIDLQQTKTKLEEQQIILKESQQVDDLKLKQGQETSNNLRAKVQEIEQWLHRLQDDFHRSNSEHAALMAAQRAARQGSQANKQEIKEWSIQPRLMDILQVEPQWQAVCERILGDALHAYVLETFDAVWSQREACEQQGVTVVTLKKSAPEPATRPCLADKVKGGLPLSPYPLEHIYTAEHLDEALSWLPDILENQSIVTANGFWLGKGWVKFAYSGEQDDLGLLARQQKIADLAVLVPEQQQKIAQLRTQRDQHHQQLQQSLKDNELHQCNLNTSNDALRANSTALSTNEQAIVHAQQRAATQALESEELYQLLEETSFEQTEIREKLQQLEVQCKDYEQKLELYNGEKQQWIGTLAEQNQRVDEARRILHQAELDNDREKTKIQQLSNRIDREQERLHVLQERLESLVLLCTQSVEPEVKLKEQLAQQILKHAEIESQLSLIQEQVSVLRIELEDIEKNILNYDSEVKRVQEIIGQTRMQEQALAVRASSVQESLDEFALQAQVLLAELPVGTSQSMREDELMVIVEKIKRLGAINLAAIEEFDNEQQRKVYLDAQHEDLSQALSTLETAIEKMDKETQLRLEHTFAQVNTAFKALFPRLFGGGRAQLELTCDNLLEAGIVVMAQPPGKRNSTIHLLSGGEKAMTAVALVFAIFQLNPSPFCMLDEVDAPLDDVNVGRFCDLVKEMSQFVQFLFITHNKVTMEMADHLIGVTMREPGVSRLVAVDVKQALAME